MKIIVAVDKNWAIGKNGDLLFRITDDLKRFKEITTGNVIITGRKTLETFPNKKPLLNRVNIVLTSNDNYKNESAIICKNIDEVIEKVKKYENKDIFVVGGGSVYNQMIDLCDTAYVTKIDYSVENPDTFMINLDSRKDWFILEESNVFYENDIPFKYVTYKRKL